jgi:MYXO-CTERM domain-containing protein
MRARLAVRGVSFASLLLVLALAPMTGGAAFQASQLPVAYWPLDETASPSMDVVGNLAGTWFGTPTTITAPLPPNTFNTAASRAVQLNGATGDHYIEAANAAVLENLQEASYSISVWYRPTGVPTGSGGDNTANHGIVVKAGYHEGLHYSAAREFVSEKWCNTAPDWRGTGSWGIVNAENGPWYHLVHTWDRPTGYVRTYVTPAGGATTIYTSGDYPDNEPSREFNQTNWRFGIAGPGYTQWKWAAIGQIDEVRFYNYRLDDNQVAVLAAGVPTPTNVVATGIPEAITITWNAPPQTGVTYTYTLVRIDSSGNRTTLVTGYSGTSYTDNVGTIQTNTYEVTATSVATSGPATSNAATSINYPPRYNDHEEGSKDRDCACGSGAPPGSPWILLPLALAAFFLRRR